MSRSSLARQEKNRLKGKLKVLPVNEEIVDRKNMVPMECDAHFNISALLVENIKSSRYFHSLCEISEVHAVVDQIYYKASDAEPWVPGAARAPSPLFCLLYKLLLLKVTVKQMHMLLTHVDSPYIRVAGFLYLRFTCPAAQLWDWIEPYINDVEEFSPAHNSKATTTIGAWVQSLISEQKYFGTIFPRIPQLLQRQLMVKILRKTEEAERAEKNKPLVGRVVVGLELRAIYSADQKWYDARVDKVNDQDGTFTVTFLPEAEYGNQEVVHLGQLDLSSTSIGAAGASSVSATRRTGGGSGKSRSVSRSPVRRERRRGAEDEREHKRRSLSRSHSRSRRSNNDSKRRRSPSPRRGGRGSTSHHRRHRSRSRSNSHSRSRGGRRPRDHHRTRDRRRGDQRSRERSSRGGSAGRDRSVGRGGRDRGGDGRSRRHYSRGRLSPRRGGGGGGEQRGVERSAPAPVGATDEELLQRVLEKERNKSATAGRDFAKGRVAGVRGSMAMDFGFNFSAGDNNLSGGASAGGASSRSVNDVASMAKQRELDEERRKKEAEARNSKRKARLDGLKQIYGDASVVAKGD
jgi:pre-mRNA-splicing factor 38B